MRTIIILKLSILAVALLLSACSKDDGAKPTENNNSGDSTTGPFVAKVDNAWFPKASLEFTSAKYVSSTRMLQIIGQPSDRKESIILTLMSFNTNAKSVTDWKAGSYDFNPAQISNSKYLASAEYNKWNGSTYEQWFTNWDISNIGSIVIESNDGNTIKGTFSFEGIKKNTNGSFDSSSRKNITSGAFELTISKL